MITPGIHFDVPEAEYRAAEGVAQSSAKQMLISPAHYHQYVTGPSEPPSDAQKIGTLTHSLVLCNHVGFVGTPKEAPKKPSKAQLEAKKPSQDTLDAIFWWDAFKNEHKGLEIISREEADDLLRMDAAVKAHPIASQILSRKGNNEVACWKLHEPTGLVIKGRADRVCEDNQGYTVIPDLKTVQRGYASKDRFSYEIKKWGYDFQAAFYLDLFEASFFCFIVVEKEPPYAVACYNLSPRSLERGRKKYQAALQQIKACQDSGKWPAYSETMNEIDLPEWELRKEDL